MKFHRKPLIWIISIIAALGVIAAAIAIIRPHSPADRELAADRLRLRQILKSLDTDFWEDPNRSLGPAGEAVALAERTHDSSDLARALLKKAGCFQILDRADSALAYYQAGLGVAEALRNDSLLAKSKNGIANYYLRKEDYPAATRYLTEALKSSEKAGYKHVTGLIYNGLGLVSISLKEYDKAISYFGKAWQICKETGDLSNEAGISLNIASCYAELQDYSRARDYYQSNLNTLLTLKDTTQIVLAYINLGIVNRSLGDFRESYRNLGRALACFSTFKNQSLLCTTLLEIGTLYLDQGNLSMARKVLRQALGISTGTLSKTNSMEALSRLSAIEEKEGNYALSLEYFKRYTLIKDSVMNDETRKSIAEIRLKSEVQKKEFENELLNKKYEIQKRKNLNLGIILGSVIIGILLVGLLIWLSLNNLKKSYRLQELSNTRLREKIESDETINRLEKLRFLAEIDAKNKELTTTSLQLVSKNKILSDISKKAEEFYKTGAMEKNSYNGLQRIVRDNLNSDQEWAQFKELFENVHQDFFTRLKSNYPELSENELRLCAYLKINLQNKEIARIMNVSPPTVITSRYRIRKKFRLETETVLEDFLRTF
jgi:tetratricopeptide (TPR) repeat protein/DNA-binding CsgD family transcriptional regulator